MVRSFVLIFFTMLLNGAAQTPCESLKSLALPDATITAAESLPAGPRELPAAPGSSKLSLMLPAYCRVAAVLKPSSDSDIQMEIWLPADIWNGKFQAVGNGGFAGVISYPAMSYALQEGYATASTDTAHKGANALFGIGHPEKVVDYAYRAVHEMTVKAKAIIATYYGKNPRLSYWNGCSTGGRQGLTEAQRYPEDFDGIVAGAPANYHSHLHAFDMFTNVPVLKNPEASLPAAELSLLSEAVMRACDSLDGLQDGLLADPHKCRFDPATLLCRGAETDSCPTAPQVETAKRFYGPAKMKSGQLIFPGKSFGSEKEWLVSATQPPAVAIGTFQLTYQDQNWDARTFDTERDPALADEKTIFMNAIQPDLTAFKAHGGKLLLYHRWNDPLISPDNTVNYYSSVLAKMGPRLDNWMRLFMAPGMAHCSGGVGPNQANFIAVMERWREAGESPDQILSYHVTDNRTEWI
jgi:feruloyl esterase